VKLSTYLREVDTLVRLREQHARLFEGLPHGSNEKPQAATGVGLAKPLGDLLRRAVDPRVPTRVAVGRVYLATREDMRAAHEAALMVPAEHERFEPAFRLPEHDDGRCISDGFVGRPCAHDSRDTNTCVVDTPIAFAMRASVSSDGV
jgi:hypothetical protein